jgi:SlyX protein
MADTPDHDRLTPLEELAAHLARTVDDLSAVIARQDAELATLRRQVAWLMDREKSRDRDAAGGVFIEGERPPHY